MITEPTTVGVARTRVGLTALAAVAALLVAVALAIALIGSDPMESPAERAGAAVIVDRALLHDYGLRHEFLPRSASIVDTSVDYSRHDYGLRHPPQTDSQAGANSLATSHDFALREMARDQGRFDEWANSPDFGLREMARQPYD
jgi:hypothetical protein